MISPGDLASARRELDRECERVGRDPATAPITAFANTSNLSNLGDFADAGADRVVFTMGSTPDRDPFGRIEEIAKAGGL